MKTLLTIAAAAFIFTTASAQEKRASSAPQPVPMTAPAMKTQNTQTPQTKSEAAPQQNSQTAPAPKPSGTSTQTKKGTDNKAETAPASIPPVDNKIAVSDPGAPGEKSNTKKTATPQPTETKKATNSTGVSPK